MSLQHPRALVHAMRRVGQLAPVDDPVLLVGSRDRTRRAVVELLGLFRDPDGLRVVDAATCPNPGQV